MGKKNKIENFDSTENQDLEQILIDEQIEKTRLRKEKFTKLLGRINYVDYKLTTEERAFIDNLKNFKYEMGTELNRLLKLLFNDYVVICGACSPAQLNAKIAKLISYASLDVPEENEIESDDIV